MRFQLSGLGLRVITKTMEEEKRKRILPRSVLRKIHKKGFLAESWIMCGITEENYEKYLDDVHYWKMHPINGRYSSWIDDKLTLKYMLAGNEKLRKVMPDYYWHIDAKGGLLPLLDCPMHCSQERGVQGVLQLLKEKKNLGLKMICGSLGEGFYKLSWENGEYSINGINKTEAELTVFISSLREYLIMEFLTPHAYIAQYNGKTTNTIRYLSARLDDEVKMLRGYIRFGTKQSGYVDNYAAGGVLCYFDEVGVFKHGNIIRDDKNERIMEHPDTSEPLAGQLPQFEKMKKIAEEIHFWLPQLQYCGIDFVYTSEAEYKVLEINSLTSLDGIQLNEPILESKYGKFFTSRMK